MGKVVDAGQMGDTNTQAGTTWIKTSSRDNLKLDIHRVFPSTKPGLSQLVQAQSSLQMVAEVNLVDTLVKAHDVVLVGSGLAASSSETVIQKISDTQLSLVTSSGWSVA